MSLRFKVATNTLVQLLGKVVNSLSSLLITVLIARQFGVSGFGEFAKIVSFVALFYLTVDFGINAAVLRREKEVKDSFLFANLLFIRILFALILIFVALSIIVFLPFNPVTLVGFSPVTKMGIIILLPTIIFQAVFITANAYFQSRLSYHRSVAASSLASIVQLSFLYLLIRFNAPLLLALGSLILGSSVMALTSLYLANFKRFFGQLKIDSWWPVLKDALPLGITLIFNLFYFRSGLLILAVFHPSSQVGIYGLAHRFFELPLTLPTFFMNAMYPLMLSYSAMGKQSFIMLIKKTLISLLTLSLIVVVITFFLSPLILLIDAKFAASIGVFRILSLSLPLFFLSSLLMWFLITVKKNFILPFIYGVVMLINLVLNLLFIPRYSYNAAAIILAFSEVIAVILLSIASLRAMRQL